MPLQTVSVPVESRGREFKQKVKKFFTRAGAMLVVLIVALACIVPAFSVSAATVTHTANPTTSKMSCSSGIFQWRGANDSVIWSYNIDDHLADGQGAIHFTVTDGELTMTGKFMDSKFITIWDENFSKALAAAETNSEIKEVCDKYDFPWDRVRYANQDLKTAMANTLGTTLYSISSGKYEGMTSIDDVLKFGENIGFTYNTGVTLGDLITDMGTSLKAWIAPAVGSSYAGAVIHMDNTIQDANNLLTRPLSGNTDVSEGGHWDSNVVNADGSYGAWVATDETSVNSTIYRVCQSICNNIILPVAGVMLAFVFAYEIYEIVCERNNMNEIGSGTFIQLILKMAIAILVVVNAWVLTQAVFSLGQILVDGAMNLPQLNGASGMMKQVEDSIKATGVDISAEDGLKWYFTFLICSDTTIDFGTILVMFMQGIIINIGMYIVSLIVSVIIYVRMIEIYLYMSLAPIPLATLTNRSWSMVGMNYIRAVIALALQAILIYLCLALFNVMVTDVITKIGNGSSDLTTQMWSVIGYSVILVFCLFKSGGLSKSIMNAH